MSQKEILIIVKTYPEFSTKYTETVCTGGVLKDSKKLVRLYPIRYRYLDGETQFKKYQWVSAELKKSMSDSRPESYNIVGNSIRLGSKIGTTANWSERKKWVLRDTNVYNSVEKLLNAQQTSKTSLGLVKPKEILECKIKMKSASEIKQANAKKNSIVKQLDMFEQKKDLEILPVRFMLKFVCDDPNCKGHDMSILDWEIGQLYRNVKNDSGWEGKIIDKINSICDSKNDTYLILGNMAGHQHVFSILGFFYPQKEKQRSLF